MKYRSGTIVWLFFATIVQGVELSGEINPSQQTVPAVARCNVNTDVFSAQSSSTAFNVSVPCAGGQGDQYTGDLADISAPLAVASPSVACEGSQAVAYEKRVLLVQRGRCAFSAKALVATAGNALGLVIVNSENNEDLLPPGTCLVNSVSENRETGQHSVCTRWCLSVLHQV